MAWWDLLPNPHVLAGAVEGATVLLLAGVAAAVLLANPRRPSNQLFALFLALIAGNGLMDAVPKLLHDPTDPSLGLALAPYGYAFLILDPALLLYFSLMYPRRNALLDRPWLPAAVVGTWLVLAALVVLRPAEVMRIPHTTPEGLLLIGYLALCYLASYLIMLDRLRREDSTLLLRQQTLLVAAFGITLLWRISLVTDELGLWQFFPPGGVVDLERGLRPLVHALLALGLLLAGAVWSLRTSPAARPFVARAHRITAVGLLVLGLFAEAAFFTAVVAGPAAGFQVSLFLASTIFSFRWGVFAVLGGYAMLRYQIFDVEVKFRQVGAAALGLALLVALAGVAWAAGAALGPLAGPLGPGQVLAFAAALVIAPGLVKWASRRVRAKLPGTPAEGEVAMRRLEAYRASLETALEDGAIRPGSEGELSALRKDLGLSEEQHRVLLDVIRLERGGGRAGARVRQGRLAGRYELGDLLGEGSFARCRLARDALLGRPVVVKEAAVLPGTNAHLHEARAASRLNHPNIVTIHDVIEGPGLSYIVMEHAEGGSLRALLRRQAGPAQDAIPILKDILAGLAAAHARNIVHGDLKPENILLTADGRAKLADFGSAYVSAAAGTLASLPAQAGPGTLAYLAPEQVEGESTSKASDLYAVAVIAHEMLTGRHYLDLEGKTPFQVQEAIVRQRPRLEEARVPAELRAWLAKGLAKAPAERWRSAEDMARELGLAARGTSSGVAAKEPRTRLPRATG